MLCMCSSMLYSGRRKSFFVVLRPVWSLFNRCIAVLLSMYRLTFPFFILCSCWILYMIRSIDRMPWSSALRDDSMLADGMHLLKPEMVRFGLEPCSMYPYVPNNLTDPSQAQ